MSGTTIIAQIFMSLRNIHAEFNGKQEKDSIICLRMGWKSHSCTLDTDILDLTLG